MLRASIIFFVLGIVSMFLGINSIAGLSIDIGKILLFVFVVLSIISFFLGRSKSKGSKFLSIALLVFTVGAQADDSVSGTAKELGNDTRRATKESVRVVKDKTCEMVNGKMECAAQKAKHVIQKGADKVEDIVD